MVADRIVNGLVDDRLAVVAVSSYLPGIVNLSGRILVCRQGASRGILAVATDDREDRIGRGPLNRNWSKQWQP